MDFSAAMSPSQLSRVDMQVNSMNAALGKREAKDVMDKDDFLKILITQLTHQDPTEPMKDKEFIAQMAQFSTLEQMSNMSQGFSKLSNLLNSGQAMSLLGKSVEVADNGTLVKGVVEEISGRDYPQVLVNGKYYDYSKVEKVKN